MDPVGMLTSLLRRSTVGERTILELDLDFGVLVAPPNNPLEALRALNAPTLRALRDGLREAAGDPSVVGLLLHIGTCPLSIAQVEELGDAVEEFGATRPVWAFSESFGELGTSLPPYVLATRAQQIWLQPSGEVSLGGVNTQVTLLRGLLDKVGIEPQFGQRKEFKTAADTFTATEITEANREMMQRIADSVASHSFGVIGRRRGLSSEELAAAAAGGMLGAEDALALRLVDRIGYRDEVYAAAREAWAGTQASLRYVHRYSRQSPAAELVAQRTKPAVGVIDVRGNIVAGRPQRPGGSGQSVAASSIICQQLRAAAKDERLKAVVLRIDSPGGSYIASDAIRREVLQLRASGRPVVASMGDLAASGGYFVAMPADEIVANPSTLTGSIGVLAGKFVINGLKERLGVVLADIASGPWATFMSSNSTFTDEHWAALNERLDAIYADFTTKAAADRRRPLDELEPLARGRVWTGADAAENGLVDRLGGMNVAVDRACSLAGLTRDEVVVRPAAANNLFTQFRPAESSEALAVTTALPARFDLDSLIAAAATRLGLDVGGALSLPFAVRVG